MEKTRSGQGRGRASVAAAGQKKEKKKRGRRMKQRVFGISLTQARARKRARTHSLTQQELFFAKGSKRSAVGYEGNCSCRPRQLHAYSTHCLTIPSPDETVSINRQIPFHPVPCIRTYVADGIRKNNFARTRKSYNGQSLSMENIFIWRYADRVTTAAIGEQIHRTNGREAVAFLSAVLYRWGTSLVSLSGYFFRSGR